MSEKRRKFEERPFHKLIKGAKTGTLAELHEALVEKGFSYQIRKGKDPFADIGEQMYKDHLGAKAILRRVERGKPAMWTGLKVGLVRTAAQPDVWMLIYPKKKRKK